MEGQLNRLKKIKLKMLANLSVVILLCVFANIYGMSDQELENVKKLVDKELAKRQMEIILAKPDKLITSVKTTTAKPTTKTTTTMTKKTDDPVNNNFIDHCFDVYGSDECYKLVHNFGMNCDEDKMDLMCEKTCGFCGNPINPMIDCKTTQFGCCDDGLTTKADPFGSTCPVCKDNSPDLCEGHSNDCNKVGMVGEWMRTNCKKTCDQCVTSSVAPGGTPGKPEEPDCADDPEQEQYCESWKETGLCDQLPELMAVHCAKTCGIC